MNAWLVGSCSIGSSKYDFFRLILWHGVALHCMEWRGIIPYGVAWHGGQDVAWYGTRLHCTGCMAFLCMSWCGIAWHGLAVLIVHTHCCWDSRFGVHPRRAITLLYIYVVKWCFTCYTVGKFWFFLCFNALNFINRCCVSLFWLLGVPAGSLFYKKLGPYWVSISKLGGPY